MELKLKWLVLRWSIFVGAIRLPGQVQTEWPRPCFTTATVNFINHLTPAVRARIMASFEPVGVARNVTLFEASDSGEYVYFPQGPLISLEQHNHVEVALIGSEGLVGWPALAGCRHSPYRAIVRGRDGVVLRIRTDLLLAMVGVVPELGMRLSRFMNVISLQMAETIGASASHRIDVRLGRWLLMRHDRVGGDELLVHHDEIAANLGVRRASVTDCLHVIEGTGAVRCRRGRITVRDRAALQTLAAGCYGAAESMYRESIGEFGKGAIKTAPQAQESSTDQPEMQRAAPVERPSFILGGIEALSS